MRVAHKARHVSVVIAETAMFRDLRVGRGVNDAQFGLDNDIRDSRIFGWVTKSLGSQLTTKNDAFDVQGGAIAFEVFNCSVGLALVLKKEECNIIGLVQSSVSVLIFEATHFRGILG